MIGVVLILTFIRHASKPSDFFDNTVKAEVFSKEMLLIPTCARFVDLMYVSLSESWLMH